MKIFKSTVLYVAIMLGSAYTSNAQSNNSDVANTPQEMVKNIDENARKEKILAIKAKTQLIRDSVVAERKKIQENIAIERDKIREELKIESDHIKAQNATQIAAFQKMKAEKLAQLKEEREQIKQEVQRIKEEQEL